VNILIFFKTVYVIFFWLRVATVSS